ncbi:putative metal-binding protein [Methanofollis sp. W23]|uniref:putative zinc-binding protein n=1 Tax=Methanofollis sp. W23 TaxID=2817849 RepID=UPI001AE2BEFE|nr:putative zinc-binding protein [Methanofollis sp. W23]MBP2146631.1 putative metal-binding protein [Methanofollis sp. W23]
MAECGCACGGGEGEGPKRIIFPCAGAANVGQITNLAAIQLAAEGFGSPACTAQLATGAGPVKTKCTEADEVVVLDGCPAACASKIAEAQGVAVDQTVIVTEEGVAKSHDLNIADDEIECIVSAVWEGKGKQGKEEKKDPDAQAGPCGCGCGCGDEE